MQKSKFADRLVRDDASVFLDGLTAEQRRPVLIQNSLPAGGEPFSEEERETFFQKLVDHGNAVSQ